MSSRTCYDKYICFKLSLILLIIGLNSQQHRHVILNCTKGCTRYKQGLTHCQMVVRRRHLHNFGPGQSMVLPEVVNRGQVSIIARRRHLKKTQ